MKCAKVDDYKLLLHLHCIIFNYYWLTFFFYRFNPDTGLLGMSYSVFKMSDLHPLGKLILSVFSLLRLVTVEEGVGEDKKSTRVNNLTLINFVIKVLGPLHERTLTIIIMGIQVKLLIKNLYQYLWRTTLQSHNLLKATKYEPRALKSIH